MLDREEVAARLAAAVLQTAPATPGQRPGQSSDMIATCRHAVAVYETILGMLPAARPQPAETAVMARRTGTGRAHETGLRKGRRVVVRQVQGDALPAAIGRGVRGAALAEAV